MLSVAGPVAPLLREAAELDAVDLTARRADPDDLCLTCYRCASIHSGSRRRSSMPSPMEATHVRAKRRRRGRACRHRVGPTPSNASPASRPADAANASDHDPAQ
jgi:hypothetical protein